ncbi:MAG TPA: ATP-binding protein [Thermoanaerobaculia bacterium]|nr:ATP-binding protein [Thermoanaerobaculia bacterium]
MITLVEALGFRSLRYISQPLGPFHVLVGPNASGKTTFLDVIAFLGRLISDGVEAAVGDRTQNFYDLLWQRKGQRFELAIEARVGEFDTIRYEVALGVGEDDQEFGLQAERVFLLAGGHRAFPEEGLFPESVKVPATLYKKADRLILGREKEDTILFLLESRDPIDLEFEPGTSALATLHPVDKSLSMLKDLLTTGVQQLVLNSLLLRKPSPPGQPRGFKPDGSNLPWVIADLEKRSPERLTQWIAHLQTAFPDIEGITTIERPEDRHRYLMVRYRGGIEVPSWMISDGTLRMLALTLPAYLPDLEGIFLIEEPENGIHPRAIETVYQSLSSVYGAQVLLATHSPIILNLVEAEQVLCFAKTPEGATTIVRGSEHPALAEWRKETNLGLLFAAGVLG